MSHTTLVDTSVLASHIEDPDWVIFDCRNDLVNAQAGATEYSNSHVPGAFFANLDDDLAGGRTGRNGRHPLPAPKRLADMLGRAGLTTGKQLVAYDAQGGLFAARLWWLARWLGHNEVAVLDGGWQQWIAENRPRSNEVPSNRSNGFRGAPESIWVDADFVLNTLGDIALLDARAPDRFRGENETLDPVDGRIPGARNRFFKDNLDGAGKFKSAPLLGDEFSALLTGAAMDKVVHSCGSGVSACHNLLAMEIAGMPGSRLYPGSWSEWCADTNRPIATGNP
ncbi:MAG: sulfurtransferase [Betaproteobacteria bacterium]|nr:sulfurtransferase [Betaproteobacteria bacterium]